MNLTLVPFREPALQHFMFLERPEGMALEGAKGIDAPVHEAVPLMSEGDHGNPALMPAGVESRRT